MRLLSALLLLFCCCFEGFLSLELETIDSVLLRGQDRLREISLHPERDNGEEILSSLIVMDYGNMQVEDFLMLRSYEKVMIAAVHSILNKTNSTDFEQLIHSLNNVILLKKPKNNAFRNEKLFWPPERFWSHKKEVSSQKLERLMKWFHSLLDDVNILNSTKFMISKSLNIYKMCEAAIPYLEKACKNKEEDPNHKIINLTVIQYPTMNNTQIKVYNIEMTLIKICSSGEITLRGLYKSYRYQAWKHIIKMMKQELKAKIRKAMKTWINDESVRQLFDDDFFIIERWFLASNYNKEE